MNSGFYIDFRSYIEDRQKKVIAKALAKQVRNLAEVIHGKNDDPRPDALEPFFYEVLRTTREKTRFTSDDWYDSLVKDWLRSKRATLAVATYYYLHTIREGQKLALQIDREIFEGETFSEKHGIHVPGGYQRADADKLKPVVKALTPEQDTATLDYAETVLADHETHDLEGAFLRFKESSTSGFWHLGAMPGMGKTAIMASLLLREVEKQKGHSVGHFFRSDGTSIAGNDLSAFYDHVLSSISFAFGLDDTPPVDRNDKVHAFRRQIRRLAEEQRITVERSLVIIVDGLDEMAMQDGDHAANPLQLPPSLPDGVYFAFSTRSGQGQEHRFPGTPFSSVVIDAKAEAHRATVRRYVERVAASKPYITEYHRHVGRRAGDDARADFADRLAEEAGYNFMVLRSVLNDPGYWLNAEARPSLSGDLTDYYDDQVKRMRSHASEGVDEHAIFCLALREKVSNALLQRLLNTGNSNAVGQRVRDVIGRWRDQGLIISSTRNGRVWFALYHDTFRKFLATRLRSEDRADFLIPFAASLRVMLRNPDDYDRLEADTPEIIEEFCALLVRLLLATDNVGALKSVLTGLRFWSLACQAEGGLTPIFGELGRVRPTRLHRSRLNALFERSAALLLEWVAAGELDPEYETRRGLGELHLMALTAEPAFVPDAEALTLSRFISDAALRLDSSDKAVADRAQLFFQIMREDRRKNDTDAAWRRCEAIEALLKPYEHVMWSRLRYDQGMLLHVRGDYPRAVALLHESAAKARDGGDAVREIASLYRATLGEYLLESRSPENAYLMLSDLYDRLAAIARAGTADARFVMEGQYNLIVSSGQLSFEAAPDDFARWHRRVMEHPLTIAGTEKGNPAYEFYRLQSIARYHALAGRADAAAGAFASYLDVALPGLPVEPLSEVLPAIRQIARDERLEICRDYRDLARALLATDLPGAKALAVAVWDRAEQFPDTRGNGLFLKQMRGDRSRRQP